MDEREFSRTYLREFKEVKPGEYQAKYCPFCNGGQHHDQYTFSINADKHTYNCLRGKCGEKGTFKELCDKYGVEADYFTEWLKEHKQEYKPQKQYKQPTYKVQELTEPVKKYFAGRGISEATLLHVGIKSIKMHGEDLAVFQFFENGKLVMNKFKLLRAPRMIVVDGKEQKERKEWKEPGGKHVLWNMDKVSENPEFVILNEGMVDAASVIEAGFNDVVSIPSGTNDLTWIDECYEWVQKVPMWVIYVDNDEAGEKLKKELTNKFGSSKVKIVKHELKDANEELVTFGADYIKRVIESAEQPQVDGITEISKIEIVDPSKMERCPTRIEPIDKFCGGFIFPSLNVWTGKRGSGKSTMLSQSLLSCIEEAYNTFVYTGELAAGYFKLWLYLQAVGEKNVITEIDLATRIENYKPKSELISRVDAWARNRLYMYDDSNTNKEEDIMKLMLEAYKRYNCRVFVLDNLMTVKYNPNRDGKYAAQSDFADRLRIFAKQNNVVVNLVVHPNKSKDFDNDSVGGSSDITNAAHNVFWVKRIDENEKDEQLQDYDGTLLITKNRYYSTVDVEYGFKFSRKSKRFFRNRETDIKFGWEEKAPWD